MAYTQAHTCTTHTHCAVLEARNLASTRCQFAQPVFILCGHRNGHPAVNALCLCISTSHQRQLCATKPTPDFFFLRSNPTLTAVLLHAPCTRALGHLLGPGRSRTNADNYGNVLPASYGYNLCTQRPGQNQNRLSNRSAAIGHKQFVASMPAAVHGTERLSSCVLPKCHEAWRAEQRLPAVAGRHIERMEQRDYGYAQARRIHQSIRV